MEFRILGPLEVLREGQPVALGRAKERALFAILLIHANKLLTVDRLAQLLWQDDPPASAEHAIEVYVSQLRKALEPDGAPYRVLQTSPAGYSLHVNSDDLDAIRFQSIVDSARDLPAEAKLDRLKSALSLWRGAALADFATEPFAVGEAARLNDLRLQAIEDRIDAELAMGRHASLIGELVSLTTEHPLRERLSAQLMLALYRAGRQAEASDVYQRARQRLVDELGMEPGPQLQMMLKRILQHDVSLEAAEGNHRPVGVNNLPLQLTSFIGRREHVIQVRRMFAESRLLSLVGVGGSGKTRLALQVANEVVDEFPGGVRFIDLAPIGDPALIWQAFATAIAVKEESGRPLDATVKDALRSSATLLVVDNCEHLIDGVAQACAELLSACPTVRILATSRERMKIAGEHLYDVPALDVPVFGAGASVSEVMRSDAVQLFADRAAGSMAAFAITEVNASAIAELCRQLDGIPLAIELAAARTHVLSPQELLTRVRGSLTVLRTESRSTVDRQRTLEQTIHWSYRLLRLEEQKLFDTLSVFAGTFDLAAAEALGGNGTLDLLGSLIDKSLVIASADGGGGLRYRVLEVLRQFGEGRLREKGDLDLTRRRHAAYFVARAQAIDHQSSMADIGSWLPRVQLDEGNYRAALDWLKSSDSSDGLVLATSLSRYWKASGSISEGRRWLEAMIAGGSDDAELLSVALYRAGLFAYFATDNEAAWNLMSASIDLKRKLGDEAGAVRRLGSLAQVAMARGDEASAVRLAAEAQVISARVSDARAAAWANVHLGFVYLLRNDHDASIRLLTEAIPALESAGDYAGQAYVWGGLALVDIDKGHLASARSHAAKMFELIDRHTLWNENPGWLWGALLIAEAEGRYETAARVAGAIRHRETNGMAWHTGYTNKYGPAIDRALHHVNPVDRDRLLREGAAMGNAELMIEGLGIQPGSAQQN